MSILRKGAALVLCILAATSLRAEELPPGAYAQFGSHRFYHGPGLAAAVFSPDGTRIASMAHYPYDSHVSDREREAYEGTIVVWNAATGERIREIQAPKYPLFNLAFSSDGKRLAANCNATIVLFDLESGKPLRQFADLRHPDELQFSADDRRLLVTEYMEAVASVDVETGKVLKRRQAPAAPSDWLKANEYVSALFLAPDEKLLACLVDTKPDYSKVPPGVIVSPHFPSPTALLVTDTATDKVLYRKEFKSGALATFTFSRDGRRFFAGNKGTVYEAVTGKELFTLDVPVHGLTPSPDGKHAVIVSGWSDVQLWDLEARKPLFDLSAGFVCMYYSTCTFSPDGKTLLLTTDSTMRLFDVETGRERSVVGHRYPVTPRFAADGRTLFTSCPEATCTWDLSKRPEEALISRQLRNKWEVLAWDYSAEGRLTLERPRGKVRVLETATGRVVSTMEGSRGAHLGLLSQDGSRLVLWNWSRYEDEPEGVRLYDARTGKKTGEFQPLDCVGYRPVLSPNGRYLAWATTANGVTLYDTVSGKVAVKLQSSRPLSQREPTEATLLFSPDSELLFVTTYAHKLYGKPEDTEQWHTFPTRVFRVATGKEISRFDANPEKRTQGERISCAACSLDNRMLAVAEEQSGVIRVFEIASGRLRVQLAGHRHDVRGLAFSPDGSTLASGGTDNVVYLWDLTGRRTGQEEKKER